MKKKIIGVMLSAMMLTVTILSGCSSGNEENTANSTKDKEKDGTYDIVVMPKLVGVPFYTSCEEGTKKAAEELDINFFKKFFEQQNAPVRKARTGA